MTKTGLVSYNGPMREIESSGIVLTVARLAEEACYRLGADVIDRLSSARETESSPLAGEMLDALLENAHEALGLNRPLCQDTGVAVVFVDVGQDVHIKGDGLEDAVTEGVRLGYDRGFLRKSMVVDPVSERRNTGDNTPPVIHYRMVPGNQIKLSLMAKGSGAENMSRLFMLKPSEGRGGIIQAVLSTVIQAGGNACPPVIVGVGIGGTAEAAMLLAKRSLLRTVGVSSGDGEIAGLEKEILGRINETGIGTMGLGGTITALAVHIEAMPCHIASLPVAVNLQCHSARHKEAVI